MFFGYLFKHIKIIKILQYKKRAVTIIVTALVCETKENQDFNTLLYWSILVILTGGAIPRGLLPSIARYASRQHIKSSGCKPWPRMTFMLSLTSLTVLSIWAK